MPLEQLTDNAFVIPDRAARLLEQYAQKHGLSLDDAATQLTKAALGERLVRPQAASARILSFTPRTSAFLERK